MSQLPLINEELPVIVFSVTGTPITQGSKVARVVGKRFKVGNKWAVLEPRAVLIEQSDMKTKTQGSNRLAKWRKKVLAAATRQMDKQEPWGCEVELSCDFVFPRSNTHYTPVGRQLKKSAPTIPPKDLDKLIRAVGDSMSKVVYVDDRLITQHGQMRKRYADRLGAAGGVYIRVRCLM